jgi:hypothetical protein
MNEEELEEVLETIRDPHLRHTLSFGIGLHHAGLIEQVLQRFFSFFIFFLQLNKKGNINNRLGQSNM